MNGGFDGAALGTRIKLLRELRDMTLQQVADAAGLTKSHVWELEQGRSVNPTVNAVWGLSSALCVSPANLLGLNDKLPPINPIALRIAGIVDREIKRAVKAQKSEPLAACFEHQKTLPCPYCEAHDANVIIPEKIA